MNFILLGICILAGVLLRRSGMLPDDAHRGINAWILYVAMPAMALLVIPAIQWSAALLFPAAMPVVVWTGAWLTMKLFARRLSLDKNSRIALLLTAGLGNTSFLGFPLTHAYFGDRGLHVAVICDQVGFVILSTIAVIVVVNASHGPDAGWRPMVRHILRFPPFLAFIVALVFPRFVDFTILNPLLEKLAATLIPLALFSVGTQIRISEWWRELPSLTLGLAYKMLVAPALVLGMALAFRLRGIIPQASVFEAAMPPMITAAILASDHGLNPRLSSLMAGVGILVSFVSTGVWYLLLRML